MNDGEELELGTDPLKVDSDGDFWGDSLEARLSNLVIFNPMDSMFPNIPLIGIIAAIVVVAVFTLRRRRAPPPPPPPPPPESYEGAPPSEG